MHLAPKSLKFVDLTGTFIMIKQIEQIIYLLLKSYGKQTKSSQIK